MGLHTKAEPSLSTEREDHAPAEEHVRVIERDQMILKSDTIGHFENPTEHNIQSAISYVGEKASICDIVKLMVDDDNFICIWIGDDKTGHTLELKSNSIKKACKEKFNSENAIKIMIKYFHGDLSWIHDYSWEKSISQKFLENITHLARQMKKPEPGA